MKRPMLAALLSIVLTCAFLATPRVVHADGQISINVRDADLEDVLTLIAAQSKVNIVLDGGAPSVPVTLRLDHVSFRTAMSTLENAFGLAESWQAGVLHVGTADVIARAFPTSTNGVQQRIFNVVNSDPDTIARALEAVLPTGTIIVPDQHSSTVIVKGSANSVASATELVSSLDRPHYGGAATSTVSIPLSNLKASDAVTLLRSQVPSANSAQQLSPSDHPNAIVVTGSPDYVSAVRSVVAQIDKPGAQVRFQVRVLDVEPNNDTSQIGINLGGIAQSSSSGSSSSGSGSGSSSATINNGLWSLVTRRVPVGVVLNALVSLNHGKVLAEPSISSLNNEKAVLNVGEQYPIVYFNPQSGLNNVEFVNIGVNLTMTPTIGADGQVTCVLDTDYSEIDGYTSTYPIIGQRHVASTLRVANDQTIVIGGLFSDVKQDTITKFPFLGDIPIIGELFKSRSTSHTRDEVVFLITPHIVTPSDFHPASDFKDEDTQGL